MAVRVEALTRGCSTVEDDRWLTIPEVARVLDLSDTQVRRLLLAGSLSAYRLGDGLEKEGVLPGNHRVYIESVGALIARSGNPERQVRLLAEAISKRWGKMRQ